MGLRLWGVKSVGRHPAKQGHPQPPAEFPQYRVTVIVHHDRNDPASADRSVAEGTAREACRDRGEGTVEDGVRRVHGGAGGA